MASFNIHCHRLRIITNTIILRYHAKCLGLKRNKVKETETFTCPICDWRVRIWRLTARPNLEVLQDWQAKIPGLPFRPAEEEILGRIIDTAQNFRNFLAPFLEGDQSSRAIEKVPEMLFYLRKLEGAEVLLAFETNYLRQELHKWQPVAPEPPPILDKILSPSQLRPRGPMDLMGPESKSESDFIFESTILGYNEEHRP